MPALPIWLWLVLGGAGLVVVTKVLAPSQKINTIPLLRKPDAKMILSNAESFEKAINTYSASPSAPDWALQAAEAQARYEADKAKAVEEGHKLLDAWKSDINSGLKESVVGAVLIPFVAAGIEFVKLGVDAQVWLMDAIGLYESGWTEEWQAEAKNHVQWMIDNGVPFPTYVTKWHTSPMGYTKGDSGLSGLLLSFTDMGPVLSEHALEALRSMKRHAKDNPLAQAAYLLGATSTIYSWTGTNAKHAELRTVDKAYTDTDLPPPSKFLEMLIPAIATSMAQDQAVPFARWKDIVDAAWVGFDRGIQGSRDSGYRFPTAEAIARVYEAVAAEIDKIKGRSPVINPVILQPINYNPLRPYDFRKP